MCLAMPAARHARRGLSIGAVTLLSLCFVLLVNGLEAERRAHQDTTGGRKKSGLCPNADDVMLGKTELQTGMSRREMDPPPTPPTPPPEGTKEPPTPPPEGTKERAGNDDLGCIKCANFDDSPYAFVNHMSCFKGTPTNGYEPQGVIFCSKPIWPCDVEELWHPGACFEYTDGEMLFELVGSRAAGDCFTLKVHRDDMADLESLPPPTRPIEPHDFRPLDNVDDGDVDDNDALADLKMGLGIGGGVVLAGVIGVCGYIAVNRRTERVDLTPSRGNQFVRVGLNGQSYPYDGQPVGIYSQGDSTSPYIMGTHGTAPIMNADMGTKVQGAIVNDPSSGGSGEGMLKPWPKSITSNPRTDSGNLGLEGVATLSIDDLNQNCQICFETPISVRFLPCKHATFCRNCYDSVVARTRQSKGISCNVCSSKVESVDDRVHDATYSSTEFAGQSQQECIMAPKGAQELGSGRRLSNSLPMYDMTGDEDEVPGSVPKSPRYFPVNANGAAMPPPPPPPPPPPQSHLPPGPPPPPLPEEANLA